jgi:hypothetical protein
MKTPIKTLLLISALAMVMAACATPGAGSPNPSAGQSDTPSVEPSVPPSAAPSEQPEASPEPVGTLTIVGAAVDGPGTPLADALDGDLSEPVFVNGVLFLDEDGNLFFADSLIDASVPTFGDVRVAVEGYPTDGPMWDLDDPNVTTLQEANGILFHEDVQLYGNVTP